MLKLDPSKRISLEDALKHPYLTENVPNKTDLTYLQSLKSQDYVYSNNLVQK